MFGLSFNANRCKIQCQQCKHRIKLLRNKKQILLQSLCTEVANLQREGKGSMAWIRLEAVIQVDNMLRALEILELYVEMLSQRTALLSKEKEIPVDMRGAIASIVFASTRIQELPELKEIRNMMQSKYGRKYVQEVSNENTVVEVHNANEQLVQSLIVTPPSENAKFDRLREICGTFQVDFNENQIMNEHDLCQPMPPRAANHTMGAIRTAPEADKIAGVDYIEQHFMASGPPREPQGGLTSTLTRTRDGGIEIPSSPDSLCGDELPAPPGVSPHKRVPEATTPRSPLPLASPSHFSQYSATAAAPLAADGFAAARDGAGAPAGAARAPRRTCRRTSTTRRTRRA